MKANINNLHILSADVLQDKAHKHKNLLKQDYHSKTYVKNEMNSEIRPAQAVSFSGSAISVGQKVGNFVAQNGILNSATKIVSDNEVAYNAIYSLVFAGMLKPLCIIKKKGSADEKDKVMIAAKNGLQAFVGTFLSLTIGGGLIKKAFDVVKNNLKLLTVDKETDQLKAVNYRDKKALEIARDAVIKDKTSLKEKYAYAKMLAGARDGFGKVTTFLGTMFKKYEYKPTEKEILEKSEQMVNNLVRNHKHIFEKAPDFIKELKNKDVAKGARSSLYDSFESFWKRSTDWITVISKAKIASMMLPAVTAFLFAKFKLEETKKEEIQKLEQENSAKALFNSAAYQKGLEKYGNFTKNKNDNQVAFKGSAIDKGIDVFAKGVEHLAMSGFGQGCVKLLSKVAKKPSPAMSYVESGILTGYWVGSTTLSKKIDPDQKLGLNVHTVLVTVVSSVAAFVLDTCLDPIISCAKKSYKSLLEDAVESTQKQFFETTDNKTIGEILKQTCSKLYGSQKIVDEIVKDGKLIEGDNLKEAINTLTNSYGKKLSKFKSLTIFTFIVRFLVPVLTVEASAQIKKRIKEKAKEKKEIKAQQEQAQKQENPAKTAGKV